MIVDEVDDLAVFGTELTDTGLVNAVDMEFPPESRPAQSSRQGKIGSYVYFARAPEPFGQFH